MDDDKIVDLFWIRDETAIAEVSKKYNGYCNTISYNILRSSEDAEECVNETWLRTWNSIPPSRPPVLPPFLAKIVRNLSLDYVRRNTAEKRGGGSYCLALEELQECTVGSVESAISSKELSEGMNRFLHTLPARECGLFIERYFYFRTVEEAAKKWQTSRAHASVLLHRTRKKLKKYLEQEGLL